MRFVIFMFSSFCLLFLHQIDYAFILFAFFLNSNLYYCADCFFLSLIQIVIQIFKFKIIFCLNENSTTTLGVFFYHFGIDIYFIHESKLL
jgi:hypothetical protein